VTATDASHDAQPRAPARATSWLASACALILGCGHADEPTALGVGDEIDGVDERGRPIHLRIDDVTIDPRDPAGELPLYVFSERSADGGWRPHCNADGATTVPAIVVPGSWDPRGAYDDDPSRTTFACTNGAVAKCVRLGYAPWRSFDGASLREELLACVRMIRADYCGDGVTHTREGTPIAIWDARGVIPRGDADPDHERFEAAWSADGAVYLAAPRLGQSIASIVATCPTRLAGRTSSDLPLDEAGVRARFPEARLFDARVLP